MIITSILDTDLYKLTIQQAVMKSSFLGKNFRDFNVEYEFINRKSTKFSIGFVKALIENINAMQNVSLTFNQEKYLRSLNLFDNEYIEYLKNYRFNPHQVNVTYSLEDGLKVTVKGTWLETILWEVPLLAMISELYYEDVKPFVQEEKTIRRNALLKAQRLQNTAFIEFGTRRRFSKHLQNVVLESMLGYVKGTSNVALAMRHDIPVVGTQAHEWFMAIGAAFGYQFANQIALQAWQDVYKHKLNIALTDTFTSDVFFRDIDTKFAASYAGLRQDSGNPLEFAEKAASFYQNLDIYTASKKIIFSDSLTVDKVLDIQSRYGNVFQCQYGIGTHFSNDFSVEPLNIVMKLTKCNGLGAVKLSDDVGKYTGCKKDIEISKTLLQII